MNEKMRALYIFYTKRYMLKGKCWGNGGAGMAAVKGVKDYGGVIKFINDFGVKYASPPKYRKYALRKSAKATRDMFVTLEKSEQASSNVLEVLCFNNCRHIGLYSSMKNEVDTTYLFDLIRANKTKVYYPKIKGDKIMFCEVSSQSELKPGYAGILEPDERLAVDPIILDAVIVPGLAFGKDKSRLGYGKGHYDRFFAKHKVLKIGLTIEKCRIEEIPQDKYDVPMDYVVTEEKIY